jgi:hypothetical protein
MKKLLSVALLFAGCASLPSTQMEMNLARSGGVRSMGYAPGRVAASPFPERQATLRAIDEVRSSTTSAASSLSRLAAQTAGIGGANGVFSRHVVYGSTQLQWLRSALAGSQVLAGAAEGLGDADMELGILRLAGPRLQAALFGSILLAAWVDFLNLADAVLGRCHFCSVEKLFVDMERVQRLVEPPMAALASQDPERVEAAATAMPELMGKLTREFASIREDARVAMEGGGKTMAAMQIVDMIIMISTLRMSLPRMMPPPGAPVALGTTLVMGSGGVMTGSQVVVSAEWVEMVRRLVQAGVISIPAVSAAVRIQAGQVMMSQAGGDLPQGVRDALGDGPEVRAMRQTGKAGAGMAEAPKHHVLPQEHRAWFERRGFKGPMNIDQFCVRMEQADHQALHGGGNWRLGRTWPQEWSQKVMKVLQDAEAKTGQTLTPSEILQLVAREMKESRIPMTFVPGGR